MCPLICDITESKSSRLMSPRSRSISSVRGHIVQVYGQRLVSSICSIFGRRSTWRDACPLRKVSEAARSAKAISSSSATRGTAVVADGDS